MSILVREKRQAEEHRLHTAYRKVQTIRVADLCHYYLLPHLFVLQCDRHKECVYVPLPLTSRLCDQQILAEDRLYGEAARQ